MSSTRREAARSGSLVTGSTGAASCCGVSLHHPYPAPPLHPIPPSPWRPCWPEFRPGFPSVESKLTTPLQSEPRQPLRRDHGDDVRNGTAIGHLITSALCQSYL